MPYGGRVALPTDPALEPMRTLELCAGYGGFALGLRLTGIPARTVCMVEREAFAAAVLAQAMQEGRLDQAPIWSDLCTFDAGPLVGRVDLVAAGFPCQPWSAAGKMRGAADERFHGVWPNILRIVGECRPTFVLLENVKLAAFEIPRSELEGLGYEVPPAVEVSAADVGAPHLRKRWWTLAVDTYANRGRFAELAELHRQAHAWKEGQPGDDAVRLRGDVPDTDGGAVRSQQGRGEPGRTGAAVADHDGAHGELADADCARPPQCVDERDQEAGRGAAARGSWWSPEPELDRVADGVACRVDRLRTIGNGMVPLAAAVALDVLLDQAFGPTN